MAWHRDKARNVNLNININVDDDDDDEHRKLSSTLPSGNNVFLVSYESIIKLQGLYIQMMYKALGIESDYDYMPDIHDGNKKYINSTSNYRYKNINATELRLNQEKALVKRQKRLQIKNKRAKRQDKEKG